VRTTSLLLLLLVLPALGQHPFRVDLPGGSPDAFAVLVEREGVPERLRLQRYSVRAEDFVLLAYRADGSTETLPPPPPATYRGVLEGDPGSVVVASLTPRGLSAHVWPSSGDVWVVEPLFGTQRGMPREAHTSRTLVPQAVACDEIQPPQSSVAPGPPSAPLAPDLFSTPTCIHEAELAYDADYEYFLRQGGTVAGTLANVEGHTAVVNEFYARDVQIQHRLTAVIVRTAKFYFHNDGGHLLDLFRTEWNTTQAGVPRDMAHLMTDKTNLSGYAGLAYVGVVCNLSYAYGWSVDSTGVVGHELGHNWGAGHCHDTSPCNNMCGACLYVGPNTRDITVAFRNSRTCLEVVGPFADPIPPYAYPDGVVLTKNQLASGPLLLDLLANDDDGNCHAYAIVDHDDPTPKGAQTSVNVYNELVYAAGQPHVGVDAFTYTVGDPTGMTSVGQVTVEVPSRELEGAWPLDEGAGTEAPDATGYGHTGTVLGGATWTSSGPYGSGLVLDGVDDSVQLPSLGLRGDAATIGTWLRRDAAQDDWTGILMTRAGEDAGLHFGTNDELRYTWTDDSGTWNWNSGLVPPQGQWVYVALVIRPDKAVIHMFEGATHHKKTHQHTHGVVRFSGQSFLGADPDDPARQFEGALAYTVVYDRALGAQELANLALLGGRAEAPAPRDGGPHTLGDLAWMGTPASSRYDVYLGTDYLSVRDADTSSPEFQGNTTATTWDPGLLTAGQRWFWRVDNDVFPVTLTGDVWQFEVVQGHRWALDETSGSVAADDSGGVDGAYEGGVVLGQPGATGQTGSSIRLDGVDDLVRIPPLNLNDNRCTIAAWVRRSGTQSASTGLVLSNDGTTTAGLMVSASNKIQVTWNGSSGTTSWDTDLELPNQQWLFVAMVVEPARVTVYRGDPQGNLSTASKVIQTGNAPEAFDGDTLLGEYTSSLPRAFKGWIDEVHFIPAALQPAQVDALYRGTL
jgi:hypothetical protein